jgi:hypothetical protein
VGAIGAVVVSVGATAPGGGGETLVAGGGGPSVERVRIADTRSACTTVGCTSRFASSESGSGSPSAAGSAPVSSAGSVSICVLSGVVSAAAKSAGSAPIDVVYSGGGASVAVSLLLGFALGGMKSKPLETIGRCTSRRLMILCRTRRRRCCVAGPYGATREADCAPCRRAGGTRNPGKLKIGTARGRSGTYVGAAAARRACTNGAI